MATTTVKLEGLKGVLDTLRGLPKELKAGRIVRSAVRKGAVVIQKQAQQNVRQIVMEPNKDGRQTNSTGALAASITVRRKAPQGGRNGEAQSVGISRITKKLRASLNKSTGDPRYYAWHLEFGTERMRPHPFMRPAFMAKRQLALATIVTGLHQGIAKAMRKLQKLNGVKT